MSKTGKILIGALAAIAVIAIVALVVVLLTGGDGDELAGTRWQVRSYYDPTVEGGMASPVGDAQLTAEFTPGEATGEGMVSGSAGCNNYAADYTVDGDSLSIGPAAATRMYCEGLMEQEAAFLALLPEVGGYAIEGDSLYLKNATGTVVAELVAY